MSKKILVIGSSGQIGTELVEGLRSRFGAENVVASDIKEPQVKQDGPFAMVDAMDRRGIERRAEQLHITGRHAHLGVDALLREVDAAENGQRFPLGVEFVAQDLYLLQAHLAVKGKRGTLHTLTLQTGAQDVRVKQVAKSMGFHRCEDTWRPWGG